MAPLPYSGVSGLRGAYVIWESTAKILISPLEAVFPVADFFFSYVILGYTFGSDSDSASLMAEGYYIDVYLKDIICQAVCQVLL